MQVAVLGPVEVVDRGIRADIGSRKQRAVLAALALYRPRPVGVDALVDLVWGDAPPPAPLSSLHGYIAGLRRILEPGRGARQRAGVLVTAAPGYALRLPDDAVDAGRFAADIDGVHRRLATGGADPGLPAAPAGVGVAELAGLAARLTGALALWRGTPYQELDDAGTAVAERARLAELRLVAVEDLALIRLELGEQATVAADLTAATQEHPLRERLWALRALALARSGRQADALESVRTIRRTLAEELGVDPGPVLRSVEHAVLTQDVAVSVPAGQPAERTERTGPTVRPAGPGRRRSGLGAWPLVGRDGELDALCGLLGPAADGHVQFAMLVGEPGIGKSRLVEELAGRASERGFAAVVGRCSEDEGAPPFWPWVGVLRELTEVLGAAAVSDLAGAHGDLLAGLLPAGLTGGDPAGAGRPGAGGPSIDAERFRISHAVAGLLAAASARRMLLVALDDLHWADVSSLRLLRHLVDHVGPARMLVVATRRAHPEPAGPLAEVGAAFGRRHALRLDLAGLSDAGVTEFVRAVTGTVPVARRVSALRERTDGNPFFLVEVLRLTGGGPADPGGAGGIPVAVTDVVARRVAGLPASTQELLRTAAVIGRSYDVDLLAASVGSDPDAVLDGLDPALAAGIVQEEAVVGRFRFAHALVRDVVYRGLTASRRARRHAAVGRALTPDGDGAPAADGAPAGSAQGLDERLSEAARHWLAAGPAHARVAWRTAVRAAAQARRLHGHEEAAALLAAARGAQAQDQVCAPIERYDVLMAQADAYRWVGDRDGQLDALDHACRAASELGDVERLARAAVGTADGSLWTVRDWGVVHEPAVAVLRRVLRELPPGDSDLRCRAMLTLGGELHYADAPRERDALAEEGLAMARRIGDPALLVWAATTAFVATWHAANAEQRWRLIDEVIARTGLAEPVPDERPADQVSRTHLLTFRAVAGLETGRMAELERDLAAARADAERLRLPYPLNVLNGVEVPLRAMQGRFARADTLLAEAAELASRTSLPAKEYSAIAPLFVGIWRGRAAEFVPMLRAMHEAAPEAGVELHLLVLARVGAREEAARVLRHRPPVGRGMGWAVTFDLSITAHAAYVVGLPRLAAEVYQALLPYAGRMASAGSGGAIGPVDAYLALAAAAAGERDVAGRHADDAVALATAWDLPLVVDWLVALRVEGGF